MNIEQMNTEQGADEGGDTSSFNTLFVFDVLCSAKLIVSQFYYFAFGEY
jgi:hypothetical protein